MVKGKNTVAFDNVMVGDVWICSGQSNMEWTVRNSNQAAEEIKAANYPMIRHFKVPNTVASAPKEDITGGEWKVCSPSTVADFTAVGYFFAKELVKELNVPIGLLNTSWGGTHVETWTSRTAFENSDEFRSMISGLPRLDFDSLSKQNQAKTMQRIEGLQGSLQSAKADITSAANIDYNDNAWPQMKVPGLWEEQALGELDGVVWFRKTFNITAEQAGRAATLDLAMIDDADENFFQRNKSGSDKRV
jgi:sialate O-acetylesterase